MKAALLGVEHPHSLAHLRTLQAIDEVEAIFLWDESESALAKVRQNQGDKIEATSTDLDSILARDELFFVIAAMPNDLSTDIFTRALEAGKHVLAEKPIGRTAADTERVIAVAEHTGKALGVCYQNRRSPLIRQVRDLLSQGVIGELMSVEMRMLTTQVQFRDPQHWLFDKARSGGGMISWLGCHDIDRLRYVTGEEIVSVQAQLATRSGEAIDVEDIASLSMRLKSGTVASFHAGYILTMSGAGYHNSSYDTYNAFNGRLGRIWWSGATGDYRLFVETAHANWAAAPQRVFDYTMAQSSSYGGIYGEQFIDDFVDAARNGSTPLASGYDALQVARVVDAAYESDRSGQRVAVPHPS
jgi:predicted dehydrogenase